MRPVPGEHFVPFRRGMQYVHAVKMSRAAGSRISRVRVFSPNGSS